MKPTIAIGLRSVVFPGKTAKETHPATLIFLFVILSDVFLFDGPDFLASLLQISCSDYGFGLTL